VNTENTDLICVNVEHCGASLSEQHKAASIICLATISVLSPGYSVQVMHVSS